MAKLSLNKAAAYAGKAKADILKALNADDYSKKLSGEKNAKGHWEIDEAELDRVFGKKVLTPDQTASKNGSATPNKTSETSSLEIEVAVLREKLNSADTEKGHLLKEIDALKARAERAEAKEDTFANLIAAPQKPVEKGRGFWARLMGR